MTPSILLDQSVEGFASLALRGNKGHLCLLPEPSGALTPQLLWGDRGQDRCLALGARCRGSYAALVTAGDEAPADPDSAALKHQQYC